MWNGPDRVEDAIEVLRTSSLSTYENRRISTGALLFGKHPDACHEPPVTPSGALRYSPALNSIRSFYRLCDGLQTLALVDENGFLAEIFDVEQWAQPYSATRLPVPSPTRYQTHSRAHAVRRTRLHAPRSQWGNEDFLRTECRFSFSGTVRETHNVAFGYATIEDDSSSCKGASYAWRDLSLNLYN